MWAVAQPCHRLFKVTRTLSDLEQAGEITRKHLAEGQQY
ncbi:hypothetical protein [Pseudomonas haemolytica]